MKGLKWFFSLVDRMSGPAKRMAGAVKNIDERLKKVDGSSNALYRTFRRDFGLGDAAARSLANAMTRLGDASKSFGLLRKRAAEAYGQLDRFRGLLTGGLLAAGLSFGGIALAGKDFIDQVGFIEQQRIALETLLKSPIRGQTTLQWAVKFADATPFETVEVLDAVRTSLAMGFKTTQTEKLLTVLGDTASLTGSSLKDLVLIFGQIQASGKVTTEDLNQFAGRGIRVWEYLAKALGKSTGQVRKDVEQGLISSGTALNILLRGFEKDFGGGMEKQARSIFGLASTLKSRPQSLAFQVNQSQAAEPLRKFLSNLVDLTDFSKAPGKRIGQQLEAGLGSLFKNVFGPLASATEPDKAAKKLEAFFQTAREFVAGLQQAWPVALAVWEQFTGGIKTGLGILEDVGRALGPVVAWIGRLTGSSAAAEASLGGLNISGIALAGTLFVLFGAWRLANLVTLGGAGTLARWAGIAGGLALKSLWGLIRGSQTYIGLQMLLSRQSWITALTMARAWLVALGPIGWIILAITAIGGALVYAYNHFEGFRNFVNDTWAAIKTKGGEFLTWFLSLPQQFLEAGSNIVQGIIDGITRRWNDLKSTVGNLASGAVGWFKGLLGISSPSKVFKGLGGYLTLGLEKGITGGIPRVERSIGALGAAATLALPSASVPASAHYPAPGISTPPYTMPVPVPVPPGPARPTRSIVFERGAVVIHAKDTDAGLDQLEARVIALFERAANALGDNDG